MSLEESNPCSELFGTLKVSTDIEKKPGPCL